MLSSIYYPINYTAKTFSSAVISLLKCYYCIVFGFLFHCVKVIKFQVKLMLSLIFYIVVFPLLIVSWFMKPLRKAFQYIYLRSSILQNLFSFRAVCDENFDIKHDEPVTDIDQLAGLLGLTAEHHEVQTIDGYVLGLQRLKRKVRTSTTSASVSSSTLFLLSSSSPSSSQSNKGAVLLLHGTLQDSESFLCSGSASLAAVLCYQGYDVWLGNNRGTKYSSYHETLEPDTHHYWDYCLDDLAQFDFPSMLKYVLSKVDAPKISIVGFSQGSTQTFLGLAMYPNLCANVSVFIALAPALQPKRGGHTMLHSFVRSNYLVYGALMKLVVGDKSMVTFFLLFKNILSRKLFCLLTSLGGYLCIGWTWRNISFGRRKDLFQYTFSETSVKCAMHWVI